jgi:hypothetical protein
VIGDFTEDEAVLNWTDAGNLEPLYKAVPNLEHLTLRAGSMKLGKIELPHLKELVILSAGLDKAAIASVCQARWPNLEKLHVHTGDERKFKFADLQPILEGTRFPAVRHLGLGNSEHSDAICAALVKSKLVSRLESLDLSRGTLGDQGAATLASVKWPKLEALDVSWNFLTKVGRAALKKIANTVIDGNQQRVDDDGRYVSGNE